MAQQSSLSYFAQIGRQAILFGAIALVVLIVGRSVLSFVVTTYTRLNPPPPPPPTLGFGLLPKPVFPVQETDSRPSTIELGTIGNRFPSYPNQIRVYLMRSAQPNLLALDRSKEVAATFGFVFPPEKISQEVYRWRRSAPLPATLEMDIVHQTIDLEVDWASSVTLLDKRLIPNEQQATLEMRTIMRGANILQDDIATATPRLTYLKALAGQLKPVESISQADFVQVDVNRVDLNGEETVTAYPNKGVIRIIFSGSREKDERILLFESDYAEVDWLTAETYPLLSPQLAFQALQAGEGYIIQAPQDGSDTAIVRGVRLAYYEPITPQEYFQPVYVFDGDAGFRAIVPALSGVSFTQ